MAQPAGRRRPPLHTPSSLNLYRRCPEAYRLRYVARQPAPTRPDRPSRAASPSTTPWPAAPGLTSAKGPC